MDVAFRFSLQRRHPKVVFRGSMASLHFPLSTLPHALAGRRGMTRGRCGSLYLQRMNLAFTTICRLTGAFKEIEMRLLLRTALNLLWVVLFLAVYARG